MEVIRYRTQEGVRTALRLEPGRKWEYLVIMDFPLRVQKVAKTEARYFEPLDYPINRARRRFRHAARTCYGTLHKAPKSLREVLR